MSASEVKSPFLFVVVLRASSKKYGSAKNHRPPFVSDLRPTHGVQAQAFPQAEATDSVTPTKTKPHLFEKSHEPEVDFVLELGALAGDLLSDSEFRQFERSIVDERWDPQRNPIPGELPTHKTTSDGQVSQVAYWRDSDSRSAGGFSAMEQPRVEI